MPNIPPMQRANQAGTLRIGGPHWRINEVRSKPEEQRLGATGTEMAEGSAQPHPALRTQPNRISVLMPAVGTTDHSQRFAPLCLNLITAAGKNNASNYLKP